MGKYFCKHEWEDHFEYPAIPEFARLAIEQAGIGGQVVIGYRKCISCNKHEKVFFNGSSSPTKAQAV